MKTWCKRIIIMMLTCAMLTLIFGCSKDNDKDNGRDESKMYLTIGAVNGGLGVDWLNPIIERFEEKYANYDFGNGKIGVKVEVKKGDKYKANGQTFEGDLREMSEEIIFTEGSNYQRLAENGLLYDISDVLTTPLNYDFVTKQTIAGEEAVTLESKLSTEYANYYKLNNGYFGLPYYLARSGLVYDVALFREEGFYFDKNGEFTADLTNLSAGPDGVSGNNDDGLPATYDQFFELCDYMAYSYGITPICWTGKVKSYANGLMYGLWADYEGNEQMRLNFDFNGTATNLISVDTAGNITEIADTEINEQNGYLLAAQAGRYHALDFMYRLVSNTDYIANSSFSPNEGHTDAQSTFLYSVLTNSRIAMLVEGTWWENEADEEFKAMVKREKNEAYSKYNRWFEFMPLPKADASKASKETVIDSETLLLVNANIAGKPEKIDLAKSFIQFCHTNASLIDFAVSTNCVRPFDQTIDDDNLNKMTRFGRSLYRDWKEKDQVFCGSHSSIYRFAPNEFSVTAAEGFKTAYDSTGSAAHYFHDTPRETASSYFRASIAFHSEVWWNSTFQTVL